MVKIKRGLGRGLEALLSLGDDAPHQSLQTVAIDKLKIGKYQPRTHMDGESLNVLADSIKVQGIMQPILVREISTDSYEILAGERRWRAAKIANLSEVPVIIRFASDEDSLVVALIENIQRENLNPIEEAHGIQRLIQEFQMTHEAAAKAVGRSRSAVTNLLRLQNLAMEVQDLLMQGKLDMGHARALLSLDTSKQFQLARVIVEKNLSVREVEIRVKQLLVAGDNVDEEDLKGSKEIMREFIAVQERLANILSAKVNIAPQKNGGGMLKIQYKDKEQLEEILRKIH